MSKPKKVAVAQSCPICELPFRSGQNRAHLSWHFMDELRNFAKSMGSERECKLCANFYTNRLDNLGMHYALVHSKLDEYLGNEALVEAKRSLFKKRTKRMSSRRDCPICGQKDRVRDHIAGHFMQELLQMVHLLPTSSKCNECGYTNSSPKYLAKHLALSHCKLDELLKNKGLVDEKRQKANKRQLKGTSNYAVPMRDSVRQTTSADQRPEDERRGKGERQRHKRQAAVVDPRQDEAKRRKRHEHLKQLVARAMLGNAGVKPKTNEDGFDEENCRTMMHQAAGGVIRNTVHPTEPLPMTFATSNFMSNTNHGVGPDISHSSDEDEDDDDEEEGYLLEPLITLDVDGDQEEEEEDDYGDQEEEDEDDYGDQEEEDEDDYGDQEEEDEDDYGGIVEIVDDEEEPTYDHDLASNAYSQSSDFVLACPICDRSIVSKEHVARHFLEELSEAAEAFVADSGCPHCGFLTSDVTRMALHVALGHDQLEKLLADGDLVANKRNAFAASGEREEMIRWQKSLMIKQRATSMRLQIRSKCPICDFLNTSREHIARHFMPELMEYVATFPKGLQCVDCSYRGRKPQNLAMHVALMHLLLNQMLENEELVETKRAESMAMRKILQIDSKCPICDIPNPPREHISKHFLPELMGYVTSFLDELQCADCPYRGERPQDLAMHYALVHSLLDQMLEDEAMVATKRAESGAKPNCGQVSIGDQCPICEQAIAKGDSRVHVSWHFMDNLKDMVTLFPEPTVCRYCDIRNDSADKMAMHLALGHSKLDELLADQELVAQKREIALANQHKKVTIGPSCPICNMVFTKEQNRDHVSWHFMDELRQLVMSLADPRSCPRCPYTSSKVGHVVKHLALGHNQLDELLLDEDLVAEKRKLALAKPAKVTLGSTCLVCDMPFAAGRSRDHLVRHFLDELRDYVTYFSDPLACILCEYRGDELDYMAEHLALRHSKLYDLLADEALVSEKRDEAQRMPPLYHLDAVCPVCDYRDPPREHVAKHFMDDLMEYVQAEMPDQVNCDKCIFRGKKTQDLARHVGLFHGKLSKCLRDAAFVAHKRRSGVSESAAERALKPEAKKARSFNDGSLVSGQLADDADDCSNNHEAKPSRSVVSTSKAATVVTTSPERNTLINQDDSSTGAQQVEPTLTASSSSQASE